MRFHFITPKFPRTLILTRRGVLTLTFKKSLTLHEKMDRTLINKLNKLISEENKKKYFMFLALKKKYKLTKEDLKKIPRPYYKHIPMIKRMFDPKRHQKKLNDFLK